MAFYTQEDKFSTPP